ncbi:uncharacterized protein HMPREF1541_04541 [Cyphellophora europaea CBS 101466]|uniref:Zn(2)-C6 fungal-type domain-containing protein n=1 Tax=Cyphellophora europaea (strain CBS 101466) TaxID=1220924 RepID=W2RVC4_CYPE1|nr:uncharacterized protein HMPREF1541_04541 [Cyphellophora europaea CBS 101466]ETN40265.1 hypothetical protein HMPREF1541_04541 [Cyphellophora europaea CBS 101466]
MQGALDEAGRAAIRAEVGADALSKIACHSCRRRKVKCDRKLPHCSICTQNGQQCSYPERMLKPGPKLGSKNARHKRRRLSGSHDDDTELEYAVEQTEHSDPDPTEAPRRTVSISSSSTTLRNPKDIQSLSFIIHPSHESTSPQSQRIAESPNGRSPSSGSLVIAACAAMQIAPDMMNVLAENYFRTFMSFRLFPESRFWAQILQIQDLNTVKALLAPIAAFAVKQWEPTPAQLGFSPVVATISVAGLIEFAMKAANAALVDCGDEPPPLPLLQSLVLISHWLLIQGVRGRAWRYLGVCIRVAYELNLHLVDSGKTSDWIDNDPTGWAQDEEKRRAWWAIWEMDVFASVIRRCPTAISWLQNETFLPAEDNMWEQQQPQRSCLLEINTMSRCKVLQATGNHSPRAWFVVINSIMKDAQTISAPNGVNRSLGSELGWEGAFTPQQQAANQAERIDEARKRLTTFYNAARYFSMALPGSLKYRGQYLNFDSTAAVQVLAGTKTLRELHAQIYSIHLMTQLAFLMTLKYHLFKTSGRHTGGHGRKREGSHGSPRDGGSRSRHTESQNQENVDQYFEASNSILDITHRCNDQFYRYINPFLVNTIWLAAAVQLLRRELYCADDTEKELVHSNFEVLRMAYDQFVEYWRSIDTAKKNLDALEGQLKAFQVRAKKEAGAAGWPHATRGGDDDDDAEDADRAVAAGRYPHANAQGQRDSDLSSSRAVLDPAPATSQPSGGRPINGAVEGTYPSGSSNSLTDWSNANNDGPLADQNGIANSSQPGTMAGFGNDTFTLQDQNFFDPFGLPADFDFSMGMGSYNSFDDVFSGSVI